MRALAITAIEDTHMADLPSHPDTDDTGMGHGRGPTTRTPRWVTVVGIVVVVLFVVLHLTGVIGPGGH